MFARLLLSLLILLFLYFLCCNCDSFSVSYDGNSEDMEEELDLPLPFTFDSQDEEDVIDDQIDMPSHYKTITVDAVHEEGFSAIVTKCRPIYYTGHGEPAEDRPNYVRAASSLVWGYQKKHMAIIQGVSFGFVC